MGLSKWVLGYVMCYIGEQVIASASAEAPWRSCGNSDQGISKISHRGHDLIESEHSHGLPSVSVLRQIKVAAAIAASRETEEIVDDR